MRIAAISDVHGDLGALDAVLADVATLDVDVVGNLGDLLSGAVRPGATADRLAHDELTDRHRAWLGRAAAHPRV
ncbi:metallophosphoesterase [Geodermatophilus sp. SYSU D00691]